MVGHQLVAAAVAARGPAAVAGGTPGAVVVLQVGVAPQTAWPLATSQPEAFGQLTTTVGHLGHGFRGQICQDYVDLRRNCSPPPDMGGAVPFPSFVRVRSFVYTFVPRYFHNFLPIGLIPPALHGPAMGMAHACQSVVY